MDAASVDAAAATLWQLWRSGGHLAELPPEQRPADLDEAWAIQRALDRLAAPRVGWKIASTTPQGQAAIGVDHPLIGALYQCQLAPDGGVVAPSSIGVAEGEFAFRIVGDLDPGVAPHAREDVLAHVASVHGGLEIPEFRLDGYPRIPAPELVADFMGGGRYALGEAIAPLDLATLPEAEVVVLRNGVEEARGAGVDVLGDPCSALVWIANKLAARGEHLRDGDLVTTGGCAYLEDVRPGDVVSAVFAGRSRVTLRFEPSG